MNIARRPLLIGAAAAAMLGGAKRARAATGVTVPIRLTDDRVLVEATFGGGRAFLLALDTGGQMGLINTGIAETLNLTKVGARRLKLSFGHTDYPIFQAKNVMLGERLRLETLELGGVDRDLGDGAIGSLPALGQAGSGLAAVSFDQPLREAREAFERVYLDYQLEKHAGNVSKMAQEVGMERTHLYRKLRAVGIEIKERR